MNIDSSDAIVVRGWHRTTGHAHAAVLRWYRTVGYARHAGVGVDLGASRRPAIDGNDIEYLGGQSGRIDGREMTPEEVATVRRLLVQMSGGADDGITGRSTLVVVQEPSR